MLLESGCGTYGACCARGTEGGRLERVSGKRKEGENSEESLLSQSFVVRFPFADSFAKT